MELTPKEKQELIWFLKTVISWNSGSPYGDGENITDEKGYATIKRILKKLEV